MTAHDQDRKSTHLIYTVIGDQIRYSRIRNHVSQSELSKGIIGQSEISKYETGAKAPHPDVLKRIAERLSDPILQKYAEFLEIEALTIEKIQQINPSAILVALRAQTDMNDFHFDLAFTLCKEKYEQKRFEEVLEIVDLILSRDPVPSMRATLHFYKGTVHLFKGHYREATVWLHLSEEERESVEYKTLGKIYYNLAYGYTMMGALPQAIWYANLSCKVFSEWNYHQGNGRAKALLGTVQSRQGLYAAAQVTLTEALEVLAKWEGNDNTDVARVQLALAEALASQGKTEEAEAYIRTTIREGHRIQDMNAVSTAYLTHAKMLAVMNRRDEALHALSEAIQCAEVSRDVWCTVWANLFAAGIERSLASRITAAKRAYEATEQHEGLLLPRALAAESVYQLSCEAGAPDASYLETAVKTYRTLLENNMSITESLGILPLIR